MDTDALLAAAPPGTFVVVRRKLLQMYLVSSSDGSAGLHEAALLDSGTGDEDVVVLADDLEKAMSRLPGHEAARVSLFMQMQNGTTQFKNLAEAAIDSDGFYTAHHVKSRLQVGPAVGLCMGCTAYICMQGTRWCKRHAAMHSAQRCRLLACMQP